MMKIGPVKPMAVMSASGIFGSAANHSSSPTRVEGAAQELPADAFAAGRPPGHAATAAATAPPGRRSSAGIAPGTGRSCCARPRISAFSTLNTSPAAADHSRPLTTGSSRLSRWPVSAMRRCSGVRGSFGGVRTAVIGSPGRGAPTVGGCGHAAIVAAGARFERRHHDSAPVEAGRSKLRRQAADRRDSPPRHARVRAAACPCGSCRPS